MTLEELEKAAEILLVEDNYGDALLTREACERTGRGIRLSVVTDGEDALAMLRGERAGYESYRPDIILLDLNLPRMDGRELLAVIKAEPILQRIPVIVLTSSKAEIDILKSYDLKANGYIVKPVISERMAEVVASLQSFWIRTVSLPSSLETKTHGG